MKDTTYTVKEFCAIHRVFMEMYDAEIFYYCELLCAMENNAISIVKGLKSGKDIAWGLDMGDNYCYESAVYVDSLMVLEEEEMNEELER